MFQGFRRLLRGAHGDDSARRVRARAGAARPVFEPVEGRVLLDGAVITSIAADNRGLIVMGVDRDLNATTVNSSSVRVVTAGVDLVFGTSDDQLVSSTVTYSAANDQIRVQASTSANERYRVTLDSSIIRDTNGLALDGEFNGANQNSGDGVAGGDLEFFARRGATSIARFLTTSGVIDIELFQDQTPATVANFLSYADSGVYDTTFFHRLVRNFVIQGGGFTSSSNFPRIPQNPPVVNEPGIPNTRGTIAMAKLPGNPNSATTEFFFNLIDNPGLNTQNGGFTAFGRVLNAGGLTVMDALGASDIIDATPQTQFNELPVLDADAVDANGDIVTADDLLRITRISLLFEVTDTPPDTLDTSGSLVFTSGGGETTVRFFDLNGTGIGGALEHISVKFDGGNVSSITIGRDFPEVRVGIQIIGGTVGSIVDQRRGEAGDIAFVASDSRIGSIRMNEGFSGENLNNITLPTLAFSGDIDGDGDATDRLAVFVRNGGIGTLSVKQNMTGSVVLGGHAETVGIKGTAFDTDFVMGSSSNSFRNPAFNFGSAQNTSISSERPITSISAAEFRHLNGPANEIEAPSLGSLSVRGGRDIEGNFEGTIRLSSTGTSLGSVSVKGNVLDTQWLLAGGSGTVRIGGDAVNFLFQGQTDLAFLNAGSLLNASVNFANRINNIAVGEFVGGLMTSKTYGSIRSAGDFTIDLTASGFGDTPVVIDRVQVGGGIGGGDWSLNGTVNSFTVKGDVTDLSVLVTRDVNKLSWGAVTNTTLDFGNVLKNASVVCWVDGLLRGPTADLFATRGESRRDLPGLFSGDYQIGTMGRFMLGRGGDLDSDAFTGGRMNALIVDGNIRDTNIRLNLQSTSSEDYALKEMRLKGSMINSELRTPTGRMGTLKLGAMELSRIYAGAPNNLTTLPGSASGFSGLAGIEFVSITGRNFVSNFDRSIIASSRLSRADLGRINTNNFGTPMGIAATGIFRVSGDADGTDVLLIDPTESPAAIGDFQVRVDFAPPA